MQDDRVPQSRITMIIVSEMNITCVCRLWRVQCDWGAAKLESGTEAANWKVVQRFSVMACLPTWCVISARKLRVLTSIMDIA